MTRLASRRVCRLVTSLFRISYLLVKLASFSEPPSYSSMCWWLIPFARESLLKET
jgi:hypothetical protein